MPVTPDDVLDAVASAVSALRAGADRGWWAPAGELEWNCWETVEHIADDLVFYGAQLGAPGYGDHLPLEAAARTPGIEENVIRSEPAAGPEGLFAVLTASRALLAAIVRVTPPGVTGHHTFGPADAEASAAMGVLETLVHTRDVAQGLGVPFDPDHDLCARVLERLFTDVSPAADPWTTLLWACGRIALPDRPRREARIGDQTGGRVAPFLSTSDFVADHARMLTAGVTFLEEPRHEPCGSVAAFADPFGNQWDLIQHRSA